MRKRPLGLMIHGAAIAAMLLTTSCAMVGVPDSRNVNIPSPTMADSRKKAINERPDSVMYLPLGEDVLVPEVLEDDDFPREMVGPFELRGETLAGALQLILADYDISLAFETQEGLTRRITVANLRGDLGKVVHQVCSLANLYCSYEDGTITVKDTQTFTVTLPPLGGTDEESEFLDDVAEGLSAILGPDADKPIVDPTTRTIVYMATQRTADVATRYFQRLRANTAMIVFETYIWEVSLNSGNSTGVDWTQLASFGKFNNSLSINGTIGADFTNPISIGLPTTQDINGTPSDILQFLSQFGAVKTISQPQITVLSGSQAELRVADTRNYVSQIATTLSEGQATTSVNTDSVDTGFTLQIGSSWDKSTVYANIDIELTDVKQIDDFAFSDEGDAGTNTRIQLPQTSERQLTTQIRVRPGDSVLIAGLVRENDNFGEEGVGFMQPFLPQSRTAQTENLELVILLRPRVIVYTAANDKRYVDYAMKKHKAPGSAEDVVSPQTPASSYGNVYSTPAAAPPVDVVQEEIPAGMPAPLSATPVTSPLASPEPVPVPPAKSAVPVTPAPAPVPAPVSAMPAPAPVAPVPLTSAPSWEQPMPVPVTPSPVSAAPAPALVVPPSDDGRFRRGSGFVSKSDGPTPIAPAYVPPSRTLASPSSNDSVSVTPLSAAPSSVIPLYDADSIPATQTTGQPASGQPSPSAYETYDYYTPAR